ncbi:MAG: F0F1 ATP synthase subunit epsilon [Acidimicrobiia bacterium]
MSSMANTFQVDVVSPEATVWSGTATFLLAKTPEGELGIMANHEPLMGSLVTGVVIVEGEDGSRTSIGVHGGFLQVVDNQVTLITDRAQIATGGKEEAQQVAEELAAREEEPAT